MALAASSSFRQGSGGGQNLRQSSSGNQLMRSSTADKLNADKQVSQLEKVLINGRGPSLSKNDSKLSGDGGCNPKDDNEANKTALDLESSPSQKISRKKKMMKFFGMGNFEHCDLDFMDLCNSRYPEKTWDQLTFAQQVGLVRDALKPRHLLLDPHCEYLKHWDMLILFALVYTSIVTPYEVAFLETEMNGLFFFNRFIDLVFVKDMLMQFRLKVQIVTQKGSIWIREPKGIVRRYIKGWFVIDLISVLPFDIVGFILDDPEVQKLKVVRVIRLMRLLKLMRVLRASRIFTRWRNHTSLSFASQGIIKFAITLVTISHWMGCLWGMLGVLLANATCNDDTYEPKDTSWITAHDWGPDSACSHIDVYLAALHFSVMTITSIGYGDISPTRKEEHILCIICQLSGGLTWAYVIGSICGIISNSNPMKVAFEQGMDTLNAMLVEQKVEKSLSLRLREYLREQQYHRYLVNARQISENFSPMLRGELILDTAIGKGIQNVWYLRGVPANITVELSHALVPMQYSPREEIESLNMLNLVQRGSLARAGKILLPGNCWGEDMIIESRYLASGQPAFALNYVEILHLEKQNFDRVIDQYPFVRNKINRAAIWIAFKSAVRIVIQERKPNCKGKNAPRDDLSAQQVAHVCKIFGDSPHEDNDGKSPAMTKENVAQAVARQHGRHLSACDLIAGNVSLPTAKSTENSQVEIHVTNDAADHDRFDSLERRFDGLQDELNRVHAKQDDMLSLLHGIEQAVGCSAGALDSRRESEAKMVEGTPVKLKRAMYCGGSFDRSPCATSESVKLS